MLREITDKQTIVETIKRLDIISELLEDENGKPKYGNKVERDKVIDGFIHNSTKKHVAPYLRLLVYGPGEEIVRQGDWGGNTLYIVVEGTLDVCIMDLNGAQLKFQLHPGAPFGEMSLLAGIERTATISVPREGSAEATVLEISRPALKHLRTLPRFAAALDSAYRDRSFGHMLKSVQDATHEVFTPEQFKALSRVAKLMVYGKHHVLCQEGETIEKIIVIKGGWVRRVSGIAPDAHTSEIVEGTRMGVDFLGEGNCLGLEWKSRESLWPYSAIVMARTEVLELELEQLRSDPALLERVFKTFSNFSQVDDEREVTRDKAHPEVLRAADKEITTGIVDGNNLLVMDMDLCIRCGNCSLACHHVHGQSRLLRRGIHIERPVKAQSRRTQHVLSPQVCMHCKDPECLTGCPTGAIFRGPEGLIDIKLETCIGCFDCANQCPYDAVSMVPVQSGPDATIKPQSFTLSGQLKNFLSHSSNALTQTIAATSSATSTTAHATDTESRTADSKSVESKAADAKGMVAIKCNLCVDTPLNPPGARSKAYSCEENCPTGALVRVNPHEYFSEIQNTLGTRFHDETRAFGRNIHRSDPLARLWHIGGTLCALALAFLTLWAIRRFGMDARLGGTWLTMRWATGLLGLLGVAVVMAYPARKQVYRRRAGALRYWMLAHIYAGVAAGLILLLHSGSHTGSLVTTALYLTFDFVIASGLFGIACYVIVPRIMTSIEGEPLLIEDLVERRQELRETLNNINAKGDENLRYLIKEHITRRFDTFSYLMRQYLRRESLTALLAEARQKLKSASYYLTDRDARQQLMLAAEANATLRRVDALIYLHRLLKLWLAPHIISTSLMLMLLLVHIIQAVFFSAR